MVEPGLRWEVKQTRDTVTPGSPYYNEKAALAKTVRVENGELRWGGDPKEVQVASCAHKNDNMSCIACHSSWNPSCYGCHLPQKANLKMPNLHWDGDVSRNYVNYNFQTLRDDVYMLARDGDATGNRIGPARSSCAVHVGSYNGNRESIYVQQQTISGEGLSGIAFSTNVPHTVSGRGTTKTCSDCHVSAKNDNNAWMAQLLMQGTNSLNFIGRYCLGGGGWRTGLEGVVVTEREEPQAVIGSELAQLAFPDEFQEVRQARPRRSEQAHEHPGRDISEALRPLREDGSAERAERAASICSARAGGAACGPSTSRSSTTRHSRNASPPRRCHRLGQRFRVPTKYATCVAAPITTAPDPTRTPLPGEPRTADPSAVCLRLCHRQIRRADFGRHRHRPSTATRSTTI